MRAYRTEVIDLLAAQAPDPVRRAGDGRSVTTPRGNLISITDPKGTATVGYPRRITDALNNPTDPERTTTFIYDRVGNLLAETQPGNISPADPNDYITRYTYDDVYQTLSVIDADGKMLTMTYDNVGNVIKVVDPKWNLTPDTADSTTTYTYDFNGKVLTAGGAQLDRPVGHRLQLRIRQGRQPGEVHAEQRRRSVNRTIDTA